MPHKPRGLLAFCGRTCETVDVEHEPFTRPLRLVPDAEAWVMWPPRLPLTPMTWRRGGYGVLDKRAVHRLLHAANLPESELLHMGATRDMLDTSSRFVWEADVAPVLGRIVLDAAFNVIGGKWTGSDVHWAMARRYGEDVIEEFFS